MSNVTRFKRQPIFQEDGSICDPKTGDIIWLNSSKPDTSKAVPLAPNIVDIKAHLYALFDPAFVHAYPDAWIEIAYGRPDGKLDAAGNFSAFELEKAVAFADRKNKAGNNVYVGAALRQGDKPASGRANRDHVLDASHAWIEYDGAGDDGRINAILKEHDLTPAIVVTTGETPHPRRHLYFKLDGAVTRENLEAANTALCKLLGSDKVQDPPRVMRLAGTMNYPKPDKIDRGYVPELTKLNINKDGRAYKVEELIRLAPGSDATSDPFIDHAESAPGPGRTDADVEKLLKSINGKDGGKGEMAQPDEQCRRHLCRPRHVR